jgi:HSA/Myb-like DNA-binding domain
MPRRLSLTKKLNNSTETNTVQPTIKKVSSEIITSHSSHPPKIDINNSESTMKSNTRASSVGDTNDSRVAPPNAPLHISVNVNPLSQKPREEQIQEVLSHRKLLLQRIRQIKAASTYRLENGSKRNIAAILRELGIQTGKSEVDSYMELTNFAVAISKKQKEEEKAPLEKKGNVSLRRGGSVGKRMNATLSTNAPSTLASDVVPTSDTSGTTMPVVMHKKAPPFVSQTIPIPVKSISNDVNKKRTLMKSQKATTLRPTLPFSSSHPTSVTEPQVKPYVVFPEAISLREQRNRLNARLSVLSESRPPVHEKRDDSTCYRMSLQQRSTLPHRRKTHWDYLLEEMRWLSTDFIEERKWKTSTGRVVSSAITDHFTNQSIQENSHDTSTSKKGERNFEAESEPTVEPMMNYNSSKSQPLIILKHADPCEEDILQQKSAAASISKMLSDLWEASSFSFKENFTDKVKSHSGDLHLEMEAQKLRSENRSPSEVKQETYPLSYDAIEEGVKDIFEKVKKSLMQRTRSKGVLTKHNTMPLSLERKAADFVDLLWKNEAPLGVILGHALPCSAYHITSSLLQTHKGPHLVMCPPYRVFRWIREIQNTNESARFILLSKGTMPNVESISRSDFVLGDLSSVTTIKGLDLSIFSSIILDVFFASGTSIEKSLSSKDIRRDIHRELLSEHWWSSLLGGLSSKQQRRLCITNLFTPLITDMEETILSHLSEKERLVILAGFTAFALGPSIFRRSGSETTHRILSWSKRNVMKDEPRIGFVTTFIEKHLHSILSTFMFLPERHVDSVEGFKRENCTYETEIQLCKMSSLQQSAYDKYCHELRGALSLGGSLVDASVGFLQLRHVCFHARLRDVYVPPIHSSAQPNIQFAVDLINESAKLRELFLLLQREVGCYHDFSVFESVIPMLPNVRCNSKHASSTVPKIAILSSCPLILQITSAFLDALGLNHEFLSLSESSRSLDVGVDPIFKRQQSLLSYNNRRIDRLGFPNSRRESFVNRASNIVIGSAKELVRNDSGLTIECTNILIFLDEDWSGSDYYENRQILLHCFSHHSRSLKESYGMLIYRFVCDKTCEAVLLSDPIDINQMQEFKIDGGVTNGKRGGYLKIESNPINIYHNFVPRHTFIFPAFNIFKFIGSDLASFLISEDPLPANLESKRELKVLPFNKVNGGSSYNAMNAFVKTLQGEEIKVKSKLIWENPEDGSYQETTGIYTAFPLKLNFPIHYYLKTFLHLAAETVSYNPTISFDSIRPFHFNPDTSHSKLNTSEQNGCPPEMKLHEVGNAFLLYNDITCERFSQKRKRSETISFESQVTRQSQEITPKGNAFSKLFASWCSKGNSFVCDGSHGFEALAYFPPIPPLQKQVSIQASRELLDFQVKQKKLRTDNPPTTVDFLKRPLPENNSTIETKRPRVGCEINQSTIEEQVKTIFKPDKNPSNHFGKPQCENEAHLPNLSSQDVDEWKRLLVDTNEDYGILGPGVVPLKVQALKRANNEKIDLDHYATTFQGFIPGFEWLPSDFEEFEHARTADCDVALDFIVVIVTNKATLTNKLVTPESTILSGNSRVSSWNSDITSFPNPGLLGSNIFLDEIQLKDQVISKMHKKPSAPTLIVTKSQTSQDAPSIMAPQTGGNFAVNQFRTKDAVRYLMLEMYRKQGFGGTGLIDSIHFRYAAKLARSRIHENLLFPMRKKSTSQSLQKKRQEVSAWQAYSKGLLQWTSLIAPRGCKSLSYSSQELMQLNFGPFHVGLFSLKYQGVDDARSNFESILSLRQDQLHNLHPWSLTEDKSLYDLATRFELNWELIALSLKVKNNQSCRTPLQCSRRWLSLGSKYRSLHGSSSQMITDTFVSQSSPQTSVSDSKNSQTEVIAPMKNGFSRSLVGDGHAKDITAIEELLIPELLRPTKASYMIGQQMNHRELEELNINGKKDYRDSNTIICNALHEKQEVPNLMPGITTEKPTLVTPHPSHQQSLQAAAATNSNNGRADMWPLQILELADKQNNPATSTNMGPRSPNTKHQSRQTSLSQQYNSLGTLKAIVPPQSHTSSGK